MTNNLIYNRFIKAFLDNRETNPINLELTNTYKLALLNSSYTPEEDEIYDFYELQNAGFEVEDDNESYEAGGKYIRFIDLDKDQYGVRDADAYAWRYSISRTSWTDVYVEDVSFAVTYRVSDGLLISCHEVKPFSVKNGNLIVTWVDSPAVIIESEKDKKDIEVDSNLDLSSNNPLENKVITDLFKDLGVVFTDDGDHEKLPVVYPDGEEWVDGITKMTSFKTEQISDIFNEVMSGE